MFVEASVMQGKGDLVLTGQLGDVMKESARAALTYAKSHAEQLGIPARAIDGTDVHIHVPAGAIPKDGPAAGGAEGAGPGSAPSRPAARPPTPQNRGGTPRGRALARGGGREKGVGAGPGEKPP